MTKHTVTISCSLCPESIHQIVELPHGWTSRYDGTDNDIGFCPAHAKIAEWADAQCPGCVGGWGDCSLWNAFAYQSWKLVEQDLDSIGRGICPKRVNGSMMFSPEGGIEQLRLDEVAPTEAGAVFVLALRDYRLRYYNDDGTMKC